MILALNKANSLAFLKKKKIKGLYIPEFKVFKFYQIKKNPNEIVKKIINYFGKKKIIIRSSASDEDKLGFSNAGKYLSSNVLESNYANILNSINEVMSKLGKKDEIIVQELIYRPDISGVIFTRGINDNSPYYHINYDFSKRTNLITSGKKNPSEKHYIVFRNAPNKSKHILNKYLSIIKEIENKIGSDRLDMEFAIKDKKFYLFQCRYLKNIKYDYKIDKKIEVALNNASKKIKNLKKHNHYLPGKTTYFSNMSDWNPAEIIGTRPSLLSQSLYMELITNKIWSKSRSKMGYFNVSPCPLMINLLGMPYIDLRVDFNSFIPSGINKNLHTKLVNSYLNKLKKNKSIHDKIEFELIETCFDFFSKKNLSAFLSKTESTKYLKLLREITNKNLNLVNLEREIEISKMLLGKIENIKKSKFNQIQKIFFLIEDCKKFGTFPFSNIARLAFISTKILKSLNILGHISNEDLNLIYNSTKSITRDMNNHLSAGGKKYNKDFLKKFGHVRPQTYSITSPNYDEGYYQYFDTKIKKIKKKDRLNFNVKTVNEMNRLFKDFGFKTDFNKFIIFLQKSVYYRELSKLYFTKSIDEIFKNIKELCNYLEINLDDISAISINELISSFNNLEGLRLKDKLKLLISHNKKNNCIYNYINLPDIIIDSNDIYEFVIEKNKPNFITKSSVVGPIINYIKTIKKNDQLKGNIVLIENADPGFDFIFTHKILGLVTKYGGANSHMSIRCLENNLPAAIGVGELIYNQILNSNSILLDCNQKLINIIN